MKNKVYDEVGDFKQVPKWWTKFLKPLKKKKTLIIVSRRFGRIWFYDWWKKHFVNKKKLDGLSYKQILIDEFFAPGIPEQKYLNRFKYKAKDRKGKGRPRKSDYTPLADIQNDLNKELNNKINKSLFEK